jgi:hypothetical protein
MRFGNGAALARTEARVVLEVTRQGGVGRGRKTQDLAQYFFGIAENRWWQSHENP